MIKAEDLDLSKDENVDKLLGAVSDCRDALVDAGAPEIMIHSDCGGELEETGKVALHSIEVSAFRCKRCGHECDLSDQCMEPRYATVCNKRQKCRVRTSCHHARAHRITPECTARFPCNEYGITGAKCVATKAHEINKGESK